MDFLTWHYSKGIDVYIQKWLRQVRLVNHYYSPSLLIKTLFEPWKRLIEINSRKGFNFQRFFESLMFNIISRMMGAIVRVLLLWVALFMFILVFVGGAFGFLMWLFIPLVGIPEYFRYQKQPAIYAERLYEQMRSDNKNSFQTFYSSAAGTFFASHLSIPKQDLVSNIDPNISLPLIKNIEGIYSIFEALGKEFYSPDFLKKHEISYQLFLDTAYMWDQKTKIESGYSDEEFLGRPGLALDLIYGYTPTLDDFSVDLSAPVSFSHRLIGREDLVSKMEQVLASGNSVLLTGLSGVGKKTAIQEFAERAINGKLGPALAYQKIVELDYNSLLSGSTDANTKKDKLAQILAEAVHAGNITIMIRDIQRLTNSDIEGYDFTDIFEQYFEKRNLKIIAVATPSDYERFISRNLRLRKYLKVVDIVPPPKEDVMKILLISAINWEQTTNLTITTPALRKILEASDKYITEIPFPEKALDLLEAIIQDVQSNKRREITAEDANKTLSEKIGISFSYITEKQKIKLTNLEDLIHEKLVNQENAISLIAKSLRAKSVGAKSDERPIGSFLFLGPTGVGKTETAKVLAKIYFGSESEILRFDMAEYQSTEGISKLIGSTVVSTPGVFTTAIKNKPASLVLLDELEKASDDIRNVLMTLLDEGFIFDAFGNKILSRNLFVIATSNAGAEIVRKLVTQGVKGEELQKKTVEHILTSGIYTPEFLNRFDGVVVYEPLSPDHLKKVAALMMEKVKDLMREKNITLIYNDQVLEKLATDGYEVAFGARPMRRMVDLNMGDLLGRAILTDKMGSGDTIKILPASGKGEFDWEKM